MALSFDTSSRLPTTANTTTTADPLTLNHTCGANAKVLVAMILYAANTQRTGGAPTYNGLTMTQVESLAGVTEAVCEMWYLLNPPTGGSYQFSVQNDNTRTAWVYLASVNAGSGNSIAINDTGITEKTGSNPTVNLVTTVANTFIIACVATGDNGFAPTARTGTNIYTDDPATYGGGSQYYAYSGTGSVNITWTETTSDDYGALGVAFRELLGATDSQSAYVKGKDTLTDFQNAYVEGANPSYPVSDSQSAYTRGSTLATPDSQSAFAQGKLDATPDSQSAYTFGVIASLDNQSAFVHGKSSDITNKSSFVVGSINVTPDNKNAYTIGIQNIVDNQNAFLHGKSDSISNKIAYTKGIINVTSNKIAYITGIESFISNKQAYIVGKLDATPSNKYAYTRGKLDATPSSQLAYLLGGVFVYDSQSVYVEGYSAGGSTSDSKTAFTIGIDNIIIPDSDISASGIWWNELNSPNNLYQSIDETIPNDNDYIWNTNPTSNYYYECSLSNPIDIPGSGEVVIFWRGKDSSGSGKSRANVELRQGTTIISSGQETLTSLPTTYYFSITPSQKANITDWDDLRIRITIIIL